MSSAEPAPDDVLVHLVPEQVVHTIATLPHQTNLVRLDWKVADETRLFSLRVDHH